MVLFIGGSIGWGKFVVLRNYPMSGLCQLFQLAGWLLMIGGPLLIALKLFTQLDRNAK
jgi:hypothetical protein